MTKSPVNDKQCVYYNVKAYQWEKRPNNNNKHNNHNHNHNTNDAYHWVLKFSESRSLDFYIADPDAPNKQIYIDGKNLPIKIHDMKDSMQTQGNTLFNMFENGNYPQGIKALCARHNFDLEYSFLGVVTKKKMRFVESAFDINEQVALLGVIETTRNSAGNQIYKMVPVSYITRYILTFLFFNNFF